MDFRENTQKPREDETMASKFFEIHGVLPPVITPFTKEGKVDFEAFRKNIEKWNDTGVAGYLVLGSNGETPYLEEEDKLELIRMAAQHKAPGKLLMAGTGRENTQATIRLTKKAAEAGAQCALVLTPNYYGEQMGDEALIAFFTKVADESPIPILIYNVTKFTHVNISPRAASILSHHPNIIGMKDSSGNIAQLISFMTQGLDPEFNLLVGTASAWYPALAIGIKGSVMALANCCPQECVEVQRLFEAGDYAASLELYKRMFPVNACVTGKLGVPALKYACNQLGYQGGEPCPPLLPLTEEQQKQVDATLEKAKLV